MWDIQAEIGMEMTTGAAGVASKESYVNVPCPKPLNATKTEARCQRDRRTETEHQHNEMSSSSGIKRGENTQRKEESRHR